MSPRQTIRPEKDENIFSHDFSPTAAAAATAGSLLAPHWEDSQSLDTKLKQMENIKPEGRGGGGGSEGGLKPGGWQQCG